MNELAHTTPGDADLSSRTGSQGRHEGLVNSKPSAPSILDGLAMQAQMFVQGAAMNMLQLGRVLTEAKPLVAHGEWRSWVKENAKMSERTAEDYMKAYAEFGIDTKVAELGTTKIIRLLPMTPEERQRLMEENDVSTMSTRQLDAAIREQREKLRREAREEAQAEIERERSARIEAEKRVEEMRSRPPEVPDEVLAELQQQRQVIRDKNAEIQRLAGLGQDSLDVQQRLTRENSALQREVRERDAMLEEQQAEYDRVQSELLDLQSAQARGDAERAPADELTLEVLSSAVRQFIGTCARMPHMGRAFCTMPTATRNSYDELLRVVEGWAVGARKALESYVPEGGILIE